MGAVFFYHLTDSSLEATLPALIARARGQGWRVEVRGGEAARMDALDLALWRGPDDVFLAHGRAGGPHDALQPVILTGPGEGPGGAVDCLMALDNAPIAVEEARALARSCLIFDGADPGAVAAARDQWRGLTGAGLAAEYWAQEDGRWQKKAASGA